MPGIVAADEQAGQRREPAGTTACRPALSQSQSTRDLPMWTAVGLGARKDVRIEGALHWC